MSGVTREDQYILAGDEESAAEIQRLLRWIAIVFKFAFEHFAKNAAGKFVDELDLLGNLVVGHFFLGETAYFASGRLLVLLEDDVGFDNLAAELVRQALDRHFLDLVKLAEHFLDLAGIDAVSYTHLTLP